MQTTFTNKLLFVILSLSLFSIGVHAQTLQLNSCDNLTNWSGGLSNNTSIKKEGLGSIQWNLGVVTRLTLYGARDLSNDEMLSFWVHSNKASDQIITTILNSDNTGTSGIDYYSQTWKVDFVGWRQIHLPLSSFRKVRTPVGLDQISNIRFASDWGTSSDPSIVLHIDDIHVGHLDWQSITTIEDVNTYLPSYLNKLFEALDLDYPGLEAVKAAYNSNDIILASHLLLDHYKNGTSGSNLRKEAVPISNQVNATIDATLMEDIYSAYGATGMLPNTANGHLDWNHFGPDNDREWAYALNRHGFLTQLFNTYMDTGNPKYAEKIDDFLQDFLTFIITNDPYPGVKSNHLPIYRGLNLAIRMGNWPRLFYGLIHTEYLSEANQLLMLIHLIDHKHYTKNFHAPGGNWMATEVTNLMRATVYFPEFSDSESIIDYSVEEMSASLQEQILPDGAQMELATGYHVGAIASFEVFQSVCNEIGVTLPTAYNETINSAYDYIAYTMLPNGNGINTNDSDVVYTKNRLLSKAENESRQDWQYIGTNGMMGSEPNNSSYMFPWAGRVISRNGFGFNAHFSYFDIGPMGTNHYHYDKLHVSLFAHGRDYLVDSGRFSYSGEVATRFKSYGKGSAGHNVVLVEHGQTKQELKLTSPIDASNYRLTDRFDYAIGSVGDFNNGSEHTRAMMYAKDGLWVVVDKVELSSTPKSVETLWHWHPDCIPTNQGDISMTTFDDSNLAIIPIALDGQSINLNFIRGQESPSVQGWYSESYNQYEPNYVSSYSYTANKTFNYAAWVMVPYESEVMPTIETEVLSMSNDILELRVSTDDEEWVMTIPITNRSDLASLDHTRDLGLGCEPQVIASHTYGDLSSDRTLDGDLSTYWTTNFLNQNLEYCLNSTFDISCLDIAFSLGDERAYDFEIQVSTDGFNWSTAYDGSSSGNTEDFETFTFAPVSAALLRIVGKGNTGNDWTRVSEVRWSDCVNVQCEPILTSSFQTGNIGANTRDGSYDTRWSASGKGEYIEYCLDNPMLLSCIDIAFLNGDSRQAYFSVDVMDAAGNWTNVLDNVTSSGTTSALENFPFDPVSVQKIRITGFGNNLNQWNSITEVKWEGCRCIVGDVCDDGNPCTITDTYDNNCNCAGTFQDTDNDGICDTQECPSLSPTIFLDNTLISGTNKEIQVAVEIAELEGAPTDSPVRLFVTYDPRYPFTFDNTLSSIAGRTVQNANWTYLGNNGIEHEFVCNSIIPANGTTAFGLKAAYDPQNTTGETTFSVRLDFGTGGDCVLNNNFDDEVVIYFGN